MQVYFGTYSFWGTLGLFSYSVCPLDPCTSLPAFHPAPVPWEAGREGLHQLGPFALISCWVQPKGGTAGDHRVGEIEVGVFASRWGCGLAAAMVLH